MKIELYTDEDLQGIDMVVGKIVEDMEKNGVDISDPAERTKILRIVLQKAFELHPAPTLPVWISIKEQEPTIADTDDSNEVVYMNNDGDITVYDLKFIDDFSYWMHCSSIASLPKKTVIIPMDPHAGFDEWYERATMPERYAAAIHGWKAVVENPELVKK